MSVELKQLFYIVQVDLNLYERELCGLKHIVWYCQKKKNTFHDILLDMQ